MRWRTFGTIAVVTLAAAPLAAQQVASPHGRLPKGLDCSACHTVSGWRPARAHMEFDHASTGFALTGRHTAATCIQCHLGLRFDQPTAGGATCSSCHVDIHRGRLGNDCARCHNTRRFSDVQGVAIHQQTAFPLTGAHLLINCESCHKDERGGAFAPLPTDCVACHLKDYQAAQSVNHVAANFPTTCEQCHTTVSFAHNAVFDHISASHGFPLLGVHARIPCTDCHDPNTKTVRFQPANANDCASCHQPDYDRAHGGSSFPLTCLDCHNVETWGGLNIDHAAVANGFALVGAHATIPCTACHVPKTFALLFHPTDQNDCYSCHQADYQTAHNGVFPTTCTNCHNVNTWGGATFDHATVANGFALVGAHTSLQCTACHEPKTFALLYHPANQNDCYACHQSQYDQAHSGTGFPTTCLTCHNVNSWSGATFQDHDAQFFPIYSGRHAGTWSSCTTCHNVAADYKQFTCFSCHAHDQTTTDSHHTGVPNYVYQSSACYTCHPRGQAGG